jgi:hypothetical protein
VQRFVRLAMLGMVLFVFGCAKPWVLYKEPKVPLSAYGKYNIVIDNDTWLNERMHAKNEKDAERYRDTVRQQGEMMKAYAAKIIDAWPHDNDRVATLNIELIDYNPGSGAMRAFVGGGFGKGRVLYDLKIMDGPQVLASFQVGEEIKGGLFGADKYLTVRSLGKRVQKFLEQYK